MASTSHFNYKRKAGKPSLISRFVVHYPRGHKPVKRFQKLPPITQEERDKLMREYEEKKERDTHQGTEVRQGSEQSSEDRTRGRKAKHKEETT